MGEVERGWGGPIAIGVALVVMLLIHLAMKRWGKIDNPSPTAEDTGSAGASWLVKWGIRARGADATEGDVDLGETLEDWLIGNMRSMGWRELVTEAAREFDVPTREVIDLVDELKREGY